MNQNINVLYFASLREYTTQAQETRQTNATTPAELYTELQTIYDFDLPQERLRAAVNHAFCDWHTLLKDGDTVAFIPPVSGG